MIKIKITETDVSTRLDAFLASCQDLKISRQYIQELIKAGNVLVNDIKSKSSYKLKMNDEVSLDVPEPEALNIEAENIPLDIVYEDDDLMVINKPINMVTHPTDNVRSGTLVNALLYHFRNSVDSKLSSINGVLRPGIVHRLDKDTSGLMVVAKNDNAHRSLAEQIQTRILERNYQCIVHNNIKSDKGVIDQPIGRSQRERKKMAVYQRGMEEQKNVRKAVTNWFILKRLEYKEKQYCLMRCKLDTGRTHQIRVHLSWLGHPIVGDLAYGGAKKNLFNATRPMLHSCKMSFVHPRKGNLMSFESELPSDFQRVLQILEQC